jgi:hypothetical protein
MSAHSLVCGTSQGLTPHICHASLANGNHACYQGAVPSQVFHTGTYPGSVFPPSTPCSSLPLLSPTLSLPLSSSCPAHPAPITPCPSCPPESSCPACPALFPAHTLLPFPLPSCHPWPSLLLMFTSPISPSSRLPFPVLPICLSHPLSASQSHKSLYVMLCKKESC